MHCLLNFSHVMRPHLSPCFCPVVYGSHSPLTFMNSGSSQLHTCIERASTSTTCILQMRTPTHSNLNGRQITPPAGSRVRREPILPIVILRFVAPYCVTTRPAQPRGRVRKSSVWELCAEESGLRAVGAPRSTVTSEAGHWP